MRGAPGLVVALLVALSGCNEVFRLDRVASIDAPSNVDAVWVTCLEDMFTGSSLSTRWEVYGADRGVFTNPVDDHVSITLPPYAYPGNNDNAPYGGIETTQRDFNGAAAEMEIVTVPSGMSELVLQLTADGGSYHVSVSEGLIGLGMRDNAGNVISSPDHTFEPALHQFVRLRHDTTAGEVVLETHGPGASDFTELERVTAMVSLDMTYFEIYAGTYGSNNATVAAFDNALLVGPFCEP